MAVQEVFGGSLAWVADPAPGPSKVLAHRHPDVPNLGDITAVNWSAVEPVDIITGGSPCQDLSSAGRRAGMTDGTRSNLWVQMREAIHAIRPRYVVWENVRGALSASAASAVESEPRLLGDGPRGPALRAIGRVVGDLADLGYVGGWVGLRVADLGGCHGRFRVFLVARAADAECEEQREPTVGRFRHEPRRGAGDRRPLTLLRTPTAQLAINGGSQHPDKRRAGGHGPTLADEVEHLLPTPRASDATKGGPNQRGSKGDLMLPSAVVHLLPTPVTTDAKGAAPGDLRRNSPGLRALADLLPTPAACNPNDGEGAETWLARRERVKLTAQNGNGMGMPLSIAVQLIPTPSVADAAGGHERRGGARGGELLLKGLAKEGHLDRFGNYAPVIASHERLAGRPAPSPTEPGASGKPRLSARFVEFMMCLPDGWVTDVPGLSHSEQLALLGNGVVPPQAAAALRHLLERAA